MNKLHNKNTDRFFEAVLTLKNTDECYAFFEDVCTVNEIEAIVQRFAVAEMLKNKCVYSEIVAKTGASTATISRVNRSLNYGNEGYNIVFGRMKGSE